MYLMHFKVTPKLVRFRRHPFHQYDIFEKICADNIAIGTGARSNKTNAIAELVPAIIEEDENIDEEEHVQCSIEHIPGISRAYQCFRLPPDAFKSLRDMLLRNVVERTFGIWKERFKVFSRMRQFPLSVQADIVIACVVLHNFIGRYHGHDLYFNMSQTEMQHDALDGEVDMNEEDPNLHASIGERIRGDTIRHNIATDLWNARADLGV
ncbi:hypothetical protein M5K25_020191 [Dendrobium thyrsiflorum]|uniref:DDE Tnp4 domain-containing protein n=1 Tax=Dendrobium thyrsiflorum TaxID=117978 RepID=A0ABD0U980_DENTH